MAISRLLVPLATLTFYIPGNGGIYALRGYRATRGDAYHKLLAFVARHNAPTCWFPTNDMHRIPSSCGVRSTAVASSFT